MSVVGTRPEIIRLSHVLAALDEYYEHVLVHTVQNYDCEQNQEFLTIWAFGGQPLVYMPAAYIEIY